MKGSLTATLIYFLWLSNVAAGEATDLTAGHTYSCKEIFGPLTPAGDLRHWGGQSGIWKRNTPAKAIAFGTPRFVVYHDPLEDSANRTPSSEKMTVFNFRSLIDDVQEAMMLDPLDINNHVRLLFAWMAEICLRGALSPAKMSELIVFTRFYKLLYHLELPYSEVITAKENGRLFLDDGNGSLHERISTAARLHLVSKYAQQMHRWREFAERRNAEPTSKVSSFVKEMSRHGYTEKQSWWALDIAVNCGKL